MDRMRGGGTDSIIVIGDAASAERYGPLLPGLSAARVATWEVEFRPETLAGKQGMRYFRTAAQHVATLPRLSGQRVKIDLPGVRQGLRLAIDTLRESEDGVVTYAGRIEFEMAWLFTLTIDFDHAVGAFYMDDRVFLLTVEENTGALLHEVDLSRVPRNRQTDELGNDSLAPSLLQSSLCSNYTENSFNGNVRVLFLYTPDVSSGITTLVNSIVAQFNQIALNSGVDPKNYISIAGIQQLSSNLDGRCWGSGFVSSSSVMGMMRDGTAPFANLSQWMGQSSADMAFLITSVDPNADTGGGCYITEQLENYGRIGGIAWVKDPNLPYGASTNTFALGDLTAIHEIGHVLGGRHQPGGTPDPDCARGYIQPGSNPSWITVVGEYALGTSCAFDPDDPPAQQTCTRIPLFSNKDPNITYQSQGTGNSSHDMATALNMTMTEVAGWTSYGIPTPGAVAWLDASSNCYWMNNISWAAVSGTQVYQLFKSSTSGFQSSSLIYHGSSTNIWDLGPGYYKVRACNGSGCGQLSSAVQADYFPGCL